MHRQTPFLLIALIGLALATWAGVTTLNPHPYAGFETLGNGIVYEIDSLGPAAAADIRTGDKLLSVEDRVFHSLPVLFGDRAVGDTVSISVSRGGESLTTKIVLAAVPLRANIFNVERLLIGLIFWLVGTVVWMLRPTDDAARMLFVMTQVIAAVLFGEILDPGVPAMSKLTDLLRFFLAPVVLHAFAVFPRALSLRLRTIMLRVAYAGAVLCTVLFLVSLTGSRYGQFWRVLEIIVLAVALGVLFRPQSDIPLDTRRRRRILIAGIVAGSAPVLLFTLSAYVVLGHALVPYEWTLPAIALVPIVYAYAVYKGELGQADLILNRSVVYLALTALLLGLYALLYLGLQTVFVDRDLGHAATGVSLVVFGSMMFVPLRTRLQRWVDRMFYGGWYDYRTFVQSVSVELGRTVNLDDLIERLRMAGQTMRFNSGALLWPREGAFLPRAAYGYGRHHLMQLRLPANGSLARWLEGRTHLASRLQLKAAVAAGEVASDAVPLADALDYTYWLPLTCRGRLQSILVFGNRQIEEALDPEDSAILATLSTQAAFACENIQLLESLRERLTEVENMRDELAETQARLSEGREDERLHLARELHDGPVQDLYALLHETEVLQRLRDVDAVASGLSPVRDTVQRVAGTLRDVCTELRPPFLHELGLHVTIRSHLARVQEQHPELDVVVDLRPHAERLSDRIELALFRICQEAVNNAIHHGNARRLCVRFEADAEGVVLNVSDDGRGFTVPQRWIEFGRKGHLGLLGMAERAECIGGKLTVTSAVGSGTALCVMVPSAGGRSGFQPRFPLSAGFEVNDSHAPGG